MSRIRAALIGIAMLALPTSSVASDTKLPYYLDVRLVGASGCINVVLDVDLISRAMSANGETLNRYTALSAWVSHKGGIDTVPEGYICDIDDDKLSMIWEQLLVNEILQLPDRIVDGHRTTDDKRHVLEARWTDEKQRVEVGKIVVGFNAYDLFNDERDLYQKKYRELSEYLRIIRTMKRNCKTLTEDQIASAILDTYLDTKDGHAKANLLNAYMRLGGDGSFALESEFGEVRRIYVTLLPKVKQCEPYSDLLRALLDQDQWVAWWALIGVQRCLKRANIVPSINAIKAMLGNYKDGRSDAVYTEGFDGKPRLQGHNKEKATRLLNRLMDYKVSSGLSDPTPSDSPSRSQDNDDKTKD